MARRLHVFEEALVSVRGGEHLDASTALGGQGGELGLCEGPIIVQHFNQVGDIMVDDFGPKVPVDYQFQLGFVIFRMTLIHYDEQMLAQIVNESMGGGTGPIGVEGQGPGEYGRCAPNGTLLWGRKELYGSGNHMVTVDLQTDGGVGEAQRKYLQCQLIDLPLTYKLGTGVTLVDIGFRAIPYADPYVSGWPIGVTLPHRGKVVNGIPYMLSKEVRSSGAIIWIDSQVQY